MERLIVVMADLGVPFSASTIAAIRQAHRSGVVVELREVTPRTSGTGARIVIDDVSEFCKHADLENIARRFWGDANPFVVQGAMHIARPIWAMPYYRGEAFQFKPLCTPLPGKPDYKLTPQERAAKFNERGSEPPSTLLQRMMRRGKVSL